MRQVEIAYNDGSDVWTRIPIQVPADLAEVHGDDEGPGFWDLASEALRARGIEPGDLESVVNAPDRSDPAVYADVHGAEWVEGGDLPAPDPDALPGLEAVSGKTPFGGPGLVFHTNDGYLTTTWS